MKLPLHHEIQHGIDIQQARGTRSESAPTEAEFSQQLQCIEQLNLLQKLAQRRIAVEAYF
jgi:hypothetical protein